MEEEFSAGRRLVAPDPKAEARLNADKRQVMRKVGVKRSRSSGNSAGASGEPGKLRVVSYNILAQSKLKGPKYAYCTGTQVNWQVRRNILLQELLSFQADVLCLQEVDHFEDWWRPQLSRAGYDGVYQKRARFHRDGVATFFLRDKFQLFSTEIVDFNQAGEFLGEEKSSSRIQQDNCAIVVALQPWEKSDHPSAICVANTQLVVPQCEDLKPVQRKQVLMLVRVIERFNLDFQLPVVMCGSFNMLPHDPNYYIIKHGLLREELVVPSAIESRPVAKPLCQTQVELCWTGRPECGDAPIQGYVVRRRVGGNNAIGFVEPQYFEGESLTRVVICGLGAGLTYEFLVAAVSAVGVGDWSQPSVPVATVQNPRFPPEHRYLKPVKAAGEYVVDKAIETIEDWISLDTSSAAYDPKLVDRDKAQSPTYENKELNFSVNPTRMSVGGARPSKVVHQLHLDSAYGRYENGNEPSITVNSERYRACADYIFHSSETLIPEKLLSLPIAEKESTNQSVDHDPRRARHIPDVLDTKPDRWDDTEFIDEIDYREGHKIKSPNRSFVGEWKPLETPNPGSTHSWFPNDQIPSDHAALMAEFRFNEDKLCCKWN